VRDYAVVPAAVDDDALARLDDGLLDSKFIARSQLAGSFQASRGFAVIFTHEGIAELFARFSFVEPWVRELLDGSGQQALRTWTDRLVSAPPACNAFYLNLLLIPPGGFIGPHVDATLRDVSGIEDAVPELVSVLYLREPGTERGGELALYDGAAHLVHVHPVRGAAVHFRGDLRHEVCVYETDDASALRASLVCEQYALPDEGLARMPAFSIHSKAGFDAYLRR
jgi:hypothetical protein